MEGPQFSTLAESQLYRSWNMDVIGMTNLQEAKLAREAEICFATLALVTDYDCWHPEHDQVTVEMIIETLQANAVTAQRAIADLVARLPVDRGCECATALATAIITRPGANSGRDEGRAGADHRQVRALMQPVLTVGSVAFDSIRTPSGEVSRVVGGAATFFSVAASFFTDVRLVAVVGEDFGERHMQVFGGRRIDLEGLQRVPGETFRWRGEYGLDPNSRETVYTHLNVFSDFRPHVPRRFRTSPVVFLANIHPALQLEVLDQVESPAFVALDTMNYWIDGTPAALRAVLARVHAVVINDEEARQLSGEGQPGEGRAGHSPDGAGAGDHQAGRARCADDP